MLSKPFCFTAGRRLPDSLKSATVTPTTVHLTKPPRDLQIVFQLLCNELDGVQSQVRSICAHAQQLMPSQIGKKQQLISGWVHHLQKQNVVAKQDDSPNGLLLMQRLPGTKYIKYGIWRCRKAQYETKTGRNLSVCSSFIRYVLQYCIVKSTTSTSYRKTIASKKHSTSFSCTNLDLWNFFLQQQWNWAFSFTKKKHRPLHSRHFWSRTVWRLSAASTLQGNIYLSGQFFMIQLEALRPRGKGRKLAWQGALHENIMMLRMRMLLNLLPVATCRPLRRYPRGVLSHGQPAKLLVNQPAKGGRRGRS